MGSRLGRARRGAHVVIAALAVLATYRDAHDVARAGDADDVLVAQHLAGDPDAFAALYRAHVVAVYRRLTRILGPISERDDLVQDVFLALHRALPGFRGEAKLATLIHRIAINKACEHLRRRGRRPIALATERVLDDMPGAASSPEHRAAAREELEHVLACLARLKPKKRVAYLLRVVDGLSFEQIGELVDASAETVAKRVQHGQRELDIMLARDERRRA
jgi:RNA polymerase sigma-70 factor (ECF subfamily)